MESTKKKKKVFEDLYMRENKNIVSKIKGNNIRIIISNSKVPMGMKKKLENSINKTYQVYQIPFYDRLEKDKKSQTAKLLYNGKLLVEYIKEHFEIEEVNIICYQLSYSQIMHYSILLHNEGVKHVYQFIEETGNVQPIAKCQYGLLENEVILTEKDCVYISKTEPLSQ